MGTLARLSWVELKLFLREPMTVLFSLALPLIILFMGLVVLIIVLAILLPIFELNQLVQ